MSMITIISLLLFMAIVSVITCSAVIAVEIGLDHSDMSGRSM